jgi:hypothetical protein
MKRLSTIEIAFLLLAMLFIVFGTYSVIHPTEMFVSHPGSGVISPSLDTIPPLNTLPRVERAFTDSCHLDLGLEWRGWCFTVGASSESYDSLAELSCWSGCRASAPVCIRAGVARHHSEAVKKLKITKIAGCKLLIINRRILQS